MTLRVVLDTNIILSALLFTNGRLTWIRDAWQSGNIRPVICRQTATELIRTLAYPKFKLTPVDQEEMLADILPYADTVILDEIPVQLPKCRDPYDQVFIELASASGVDMLVTGDRDLLALRDTVMFEILSADEFFDRIKP